MPWQETHKAFDENMAAAYDERFAKLAPLRDAMLLMARSILSELPADARVLSVGAGTGAEIADLAGHFPRWHFAAVEPSAPMLRVCRRRMEELGIAGRCTFHEGYLDSLPAAAPFDAATSILVSHFITDREQRLAYFLEIAARLKLGATLVNADLSGDASSPDYEEQLAVWMRMMQPAGLTAEQIENMRAAYSRDVAILPPAEVASLIESGGFAKPVPFLQTMLIHGWFARVKPVD